MEFEPAVIPIAPACEFVMVLLVILATRLSPVSPVRVIPMLLTPVIEFPLMVQFPVALSSAIPEPLFVVFAISQLLIVAPFTPFPKIASPGVP